jgi:hypothetical protein
MTEITAHVSDGGGMWGTRRSQRRNAGPVLVAIDVIEVTVR